VTALLWAHRREIGIRQGRRAGSERTWTKLVSRWFARERCTRPPPTACRHWLTKGYEGAGIGVHTPIKGAE
jgi:hypothetical protein